MRDRFINWAASAIAAIVMGLFISWQGGPPWAVAGFALLTYYMFRLRDRIDEKRG